MQTPVSLDSIKDVSLYQKVNGYRFTIDSVLIADFVNKFMPASILDVGAGTGIIGILLARKYTSSCISLLEVQHDLAVLSERNVMHNGLENQITVHNMGIEDTMNSPDFTPASYDVIVSNPPFRVPSSGKISPYDERAIARHEIRMNAEVLMRSVSYLLKSRGYFYVIFHPFRLAEMFALMRKFTLEPKRARFIYPDVLSESKMVMVESIKGTRQGMKIEKPLVIHKDGTTYTEEVERILRQ